MSSALPAQSPRKLQQQQNQFEIASSSSSHSSSGHGHGHGHHPTSILRDTFSKVNGGAPSSPTPTSADTTSNYLSTALSPRTRPRATSRSSIKSTYSVASFSSSGGSTDQSAHTALNSAGKLPTIVSGGGTRSSQGAGIVNGVSGSGRSSSSRPVSVSSVSASTSASSAIGKIQVVEKENTKRGQQQKLGVEEVKKENSSPSISTPTIETTSSLAPTSAATQAISKTKSNSSLKHEITPLEPAPPSPAPQAEMNGSSSIPTTPTPRSNHRQLDLEEEEYKAARMQRSASKGGPISASASAGSVGAGVRKSESAGSELMNGSFRQGRLNGSPSVGSLGSGSGSEMNGFGKRAAALGPSSSLDEQEYRKGTIEHEQEQEQEDMEDGEAEEESELPYREEREPSEKGSSGKGSRHEPSSGEEEQSAKQQGLQARQQQPIEDGRQSSRSVRSIASAYAPPPTPPPKSPRHTPSYFLAQDDEFEAVPALPNGGVVSAQYITPGHTEKEKQRAILAAGPQRGNRQEASEERVAYPEDRRGSGTTIKAFDEVINGEYDSEKGDSYDETMGSVASREAQRVRPLTSSASHDQFRTASSIRSSPSVGNDGTFPRGAGNAGTARSALKTRPQTSMGHLSSYKDTHSLAPSRKTSSLMRPSTSMSRPIFNRNGDPLSTFMIEGENFVVSAPGQSPVVSDPAPASEDEDDHVGGVEIVDAEEPEWATEKERRKEEAERRAEEEELRRQGTSPSFRKRLSRRVGDGSSSKELNRRSLFSGKASEGSAGTEVAASDYAASEVSQGIRHRESMQTIATTINSSLQSAVDGAETVKGSYAIDPPTVLQLFEASNKTVLSETGAVVKFGDLWKDQRTLFCFLRHWYCPFCQQFAMALKNIDPLPLQRAGLQIIVIGQGSWSIIKSFKAVMEVPFPMYADPDKSIYKALGMSLRTNDAGPSCALPDYVQYGMTKANIVAIKVSARFSLG